MLYFSTSSAFFTVNWCETKRIAVGKNLTENIKFDNYNQKNACISSMEINGILSIRYDFGRHEKDSCVNSSGLKAMFYISFNFL